MKKAFLFSSALLCGSLAFSQKPDYNEIILPQQADSQIVSAMGLSPYEEKLVQLAWQNYPSSEIYTSKVRIAEKKISLEKFSWTDNVKASFNFNQRNIESGLNTTDEAGNNYYPWYNFSIGFNIGTFVTTPLNTSIAKEELDIANAYLNQQKLSIRAEVLKRYKDYQLKVELLKIRTQAQDDAYSTHQLITRDFEKGAATLEEFIKSAAAYNAAVEAKLIASKNVLESKISLEEMIGVKLEEVGK
ncbi:MAG TPA: TolC family protein [Chitinophagales bacterium]|nr:TolC family protein [Chitinophagales bacterium]